MERRRPLRIVLLSLACSVALGAHAQGQASTGIDVPAGNLATALDMLARQSGTQLVYRADQLRDARTGGVRGTMPPREALDRLLRGSGFAARHDSSCAVVIVAQAAPPPTATPAAPAPSRPPAARTPEPEPPVAELETIEVTGSRIPRAQVEGPAPITVITAEDIQAGGFTSVMDVM